MVSSSDDSDDGVSLAELRRVASRERAKKAAAANHDAPSRENAPRRPDSDDSDDGTSLAELRRARSRVPLARKRSREPEVQPAVTVVDPAKKSLPERAAAEMTTPPSVGKQKRRRPFQDRQPPPSMESATSVVQRKVQHVHIKRRWLVVVHCEYGETNVPGLAVCRVLSFDADHAQVVTYKCNVGPTHRGFINGRHWSSGRKTEEIHRGSVIVAFERLKKNGRLPSFALRSVSESDVYARICEGPVMGHTHAEVDAL